MKHYKFHGQVRPELSSHRNIFGTILEGRSIVFTFSASAYEASRMTTLRLTSAGRCMYELNMNRIEGRVHFSTGNSKDPYRLFRTPEEDTNMVVRIYRNSFDAAVTHFVTYVNGKFIASTEAINGAMFDGVDLEITQHPYVPVKELALLATVFDESEMEQAAAFSEVMQIPEVGYFATAKQTLEGNVRVFESESTKQYKLQVPDRETDISISDGHSFVFTLPVRAFKKALDLSVSLNVGNTVLHTVNLHRSDDVINVHPGRHVLSAPRLFEEDVNVVVRVDRSLNSPGSFTTYVNGDFASTTEALNGTGGQPVDQIALTARVGLSEPVFLTVFDQSEARKAAVFAEAMRYPGVAYFKIKELEEGEKAEEDKKNAAEEKEKAVEEKEKALEEREKGVQEKEKAIEEKEKAVENKEKELKAREKAFAECEDNLKGGHTHGDGSDQPSPRTHVQPPDADMLNDSAKTAWPKAVKRVVPSKFSNVNKRHQELMSDWVVARGDNISSDAYDYFVYSHGVVWPKAVLEITTEGNLLEIQEKHKEIMKALGY